MAPFTHRLETYLNGRLVTDPIFFSRRRLYRSEARALEAAQAFLADNLKRGSYRIFAVLA